MTIDEVMMNLAEDIQKKVDTDFGAFGIVARMNTNFHVLKEHFNAKRRRGATEKIKQALRQITADAAIAQTLL